VPQSDPRDPSDAPGPQSLLLDSPGVGSFLGEVARRAVGAVGPVHYCGITVRLTPASPILGGTADELAGRMDEVQYATGDGPCLTCLREGTVVSVDDIRGDRRWPEFARRGAQAGGSLRRRSQDTNVKLRDVAAAVVAEVTRDRPRVVTPRCAVQISLYCSGDADRG
jgi:hypothetical protein